MDAFPSSHCITAGCGAALCWLFFYMLFRVCVVVSVCIVIADVLCVLLDYHGWVVCLRLLSLCAASRHMLVQPGKAWSDMCLCHVFCVMDELIVAFSWFSFSSL